MIIRPHNDFVMRQYHLHTLTTLIILPFLLPRLSSSGMRRTTHRLLLKASQLLVLLLALMVFPQASSAAIESPVAATSSSNAYTSPISSCHKLTAPLPIHRQCDGVCSHGSVASRWRPHTLDDLKAAPSCEGISTELRPQRKVTTRNETAPNWFTSRRAPFWQVFASAPRMRN